MAAKKPSGFRPVWISSILVVGIVLFAISVSPTFQECVEQSAAYPGNSEQQQKPSFASAVLSWLRCGTVAIDENHNLTLAVATIVLAIFTISLWAATNQLRRSTDRLWEAGARQIEVASKSAAAADKSASVAAQSLQVMERVAEKQLRAYVLVARGYLTFPSPGTPEAHITFKNFGQTPAYNVRIWISMWIESHPLNVILPAPTSDFQMARSIIPPGRFADMFMPKEPPVPDDAIHLLGTSAGTIYVYGEVRYFDVFKIERTTDYRLIYGGPEGTRRGRLQPDTHGNSAT